MTNHLITLGLQIVPKSESIKTYELVDRAIDVIKQSGLNYIITPFETVMEGEYEEILKVAREAEMAVLDAGADECLVYYRIHYRKNSDVTFAEKRLDR